MPVQLGWHVVADVSPAPNTAARNDGQVTPVDKFRRGGVAATLAATKVGWTLTEGASREGYVVRSCANAGMRYGLWV